MGTENEVDFDMEGAVDSVGEGLGLGPDFGEGGSGLDPDLGKPAEPAEGELTPAEPAEAKPVEGEEAKPAEGEAPAEDTPPAEGWKPPEESKHLFNEDGTLRTWRKEAAAEFAKLPPVVQAEIIKREEDIHRGIEVYKESATFGNHMKESLAPFMPVLQQHNIDPGWQAAELMKVQYGLAFGTPEAKAAIVAQIIRDYKVNMDGVSLEAPFIDPQVEALQNQLKGVQSQLQHFTTVETQKSQAGLKAHIDAFCSDPKNIYVEEVVNDMAQLLRSGSEKTIEEAYQKAIWLNPVTRQKEIARQAAETAAKAEADKAGKLAAAKKATAANVRSKGQGGSAATPLGSMDDTLNEALAAIHGRSS